ncbi:hypothetical protein MHU86_7393 [Fragilaria crotonensis]|nr:hypothetical protein MHU86_7393 [Fragilaria crotonensis]
MSAEATCNALSADGICMPLETKVLFSHNTTLDPGKLLDTMLKYRDTIERNLNLAGIQAAYDGDIPVQSEIIVSLQGNFTTGLSDSELKYFQAIARAYLKAKLADIGVDILDVQARHSAHARFLQRSDDDGTGSSNSIDVTTIVDGAYRPPPEIDFGGEVDDALGAEGGKEFRDDLVSGRRDIPEDIVKNAGALKTVTGVESKVVTQNSIAPVRETTSGNSSTAILGGVLGFLVVAFLVTLWYYRRRRKEGKKSAHVVSVGGIRSYLKFGKLNHTSPSELLDENALEAECTFIDDDPYMKEHLVHKHHLSGRYGDCTASTFENSAELRTDWTQGPFPTSEDGIQRYASIRSLPANGVSNDSDLSPHPRGNFPKSRGEYDQSAESRRPQPEMSLTGTRSQRSMGIGGRNDDSLDFNNVLEKSMSYGASMTAFNRSMGSVNSAPSMGHHEKSMASIGNGGRRSMPRSTSVNRSVGAVEPGSTMASFPTVPITDPVLREMSMTSFGSDGRSPGAPRSAFNRSMSNLGSAGRMHFPIAPVMGDTGPNQSTTSIGIGSRSPMPPRAAFETSDSMAKVESDGGGELLPRTNFDRSTGSLYNNGRMQSTMVPPINRRSLMKNETNPIAPSMALERSRSAGQGIARDRLDRRSASGRF